MLTPNLVKRRSRAVAGLCFVGIPLLGSWIWQLVRDNSYDRRNPPKDPVDWTDNGFAAVFVLFMLNWVFSALWQYIIMYFLGCLTNNPRLAANNAGVFRGIMAAGEAVTFGLDSRGVPFKIEAGLILGFYALAFFTMGYLALFVLEDSKYFQEEEVTIPEHVRREHDIQLGVDPEGLDKSGNMSSSNEEKK